MTISNSSELIYFKRVRNEIAKVFKLFHDKNIFCNKLHPLMSIQYLLVIYFLNIDMVIGLVSRIDSPYSYIKAEPHIQ